MRELYHVGNYFIEGNEPYIDTISPPTKCHCVVGDVAVISILFSLIKKAVDALCRTNAKLPTKRAIAI